MNYKKIHDNIIKRGFDRQIPLIKEKHHIIPKCMGGNDDLDNLVNLTPKEHYLIHLLLTKIYPENINLIYAFWMMSNKKGNKGRRSGKFYQAAKEFMAKHSRHLHTKEIREKIRKSRLGKVPKNIKSLHNSTKRAILEFENGILIKEYESCAEAARILGLNKGYIVSAMKYSSKNRKFPNKIWKYKDNKSRKKTNAGINSKAKFRYKIEKYDIYNNFIKLYNNIQEAAIDNNMSKDAIRAICLENNSRSLSNFIFKYKK